MEAAQQKCAFCAFHLHYFSTMFNKIFSCSKSMMLNKIVINFFLRISHRYEIKTLTPNFSTRWSCKRFDCVGHVHFTRPRLLFSDYSSIRLEIIALATDFSHCTVYYSIRCSVFRTMAIAIFFVPTYSITKSKEQSSRNFTV